MPIDAVCTNCQTPYRLAENMVGKQVRCKTCHQGFTVFDVNQPLAVPEESPLRAAVQAKSQPRTAVSAKARPTANEDSGPRRPVGGRPGRDRAEAEPIKKSRPMALILCLAIGGGVLFLGGGVTALLLLLSGKPVETANTDPETVEFENNLLGLQNVELGPRLLAVNWFSNNFKPDHPKREEVARELMILYDRHVNQPGHADIGQSLKLWATKTQAAQFYVIAQNDKAGRQNFACEMLGVLKDEKSIDYLVNRLKNNFDRVGPSRGLTAMGSIAKDKVLPLFFYPGGWNGPQLEAQKIIRSYKVSDNEIMTLALDSLKDPDVRVRVEVCRYLANPNTPVIEKRREEISKALNAPTEVAEQGLRDQALAAIERWYTKENVQPLVKRLDAKTFNTKEVRILGLLKDGRAADPLAKNLGNFQAQGEIKEALKALGPKLAARAMLAYYNEPGFGFPRDWLRGVLKGWNVKHEAIAGQCLKDLAEDQRRELALAWLATAEPVPELAAEVTAATQPLTENFFLQGNAKKVMVRWATKEQAAGNVPGYLVSLTSNNPRDRKMGFDGLKSAGPQVAGKLVLKEFNHPDLNARTMIRTLLMDWGYKNEDYVKQSLVDLNDPLRGPQALGWLNTAEVIPDLANQVTQAAKLLKKSTNPQVQFVATNVEKRWGPAASKEENPNPMTVSVETLKLGLQSPDAKVRRKAIEDLGKSKNEEAVLPLAFMLASADKAEAIKALKELGGKKTEDVMCALLTDVTKQKLVSAVCAVLRDVGTEASLEHLNLAAKFYAMQNNAFALNQVQGATKSIKSRIMK